MSADRSTSIQVTQDGKVVGFIDLTPDEAFDFILSPAGMALDDGEASWDLQEQEGGKGRLNEIASFVATASDEICLAIEAKNRAERSKPYSPNN